MEIHFNQQEEQAIQRYADKHKIEYKVAVQHMMDAMTKGLLELAEKEGEFENIKKTYTNKVDFET